MGAVDPLIVFLVVGFALFVMGTLVLGKVNVERRRARARRIGLTDFHRGSRATRDGGFGGGGAWSGDSWSGDSWGTSGDLGGDGGDGGGGGGGGGD